MNTMTLPPSTESKPIREIAYDTLKKAIITGDIDRQEELGIYEVAPEDFALPEFVDSSKLELQRIVREGLEILRKENL